MLMCGSFSRETLFNQVKKELDTVLTKLGVKTRDELDQYIRDNMKNNADLKVYDELRKRYGEPCTSHTLWPLICTLTHLVSIDKDDHTANLIVDITGLLGIGTFVIGSIAALIGIVTFAAALGALEVVGGLAAAAGLVLVAVSIYEGAVQREASLATIVFCNPIFNFLD